jgi:predicted nucleic acid-binding protein
MRSDLPKFDIIISDNSCLSALTDINRLDILKKLYNKIIITPEVKKEYNKKDNRQLPDWIEIEEPKNKEKVNQIFKELKGLGESESIVLASERPNSLLIIDERKPRNYAFEKEGLNIIGTVGVIREAGRNKIIVSQEKEDELIQQLKNTDFYLSKQVIEQSRNNIKNDELKNKEAEITKREKILEGSINALQTNQKIIHIVATELQNKQTTQPERNALWKKVFEDLPQWVSGKLAEVRNEIKNDKINQKEKDI